MKNNKSRVTNNYQMKRYLNSSMGKHFIFFYINQCFIDRNTLKCKYFGNKYQQRNKFLLRKVWRRTDTFTNVSVGIWVCAFTQKYINACMQTLTHKSISMYTNMILHFNLINISPLKIYIHFIILYKPQEICWRMNYDYRMYVMFPVITHASKSILPNLAFIWWVALLYIYI